MLTENDVVEAVCRKLKGAGYRIDHRCATHERGIDIEASRNGRTLLVEAKGETSSFQSRRVGRAFNRGQCRTHVAMAVFTAARLIQERLPRKGMGTVAIALVDNPHHRDFVGSVQSALDRLRIPIIWVSVGRRVILPDSIS